MNARLFGSSITSAIFLAALAFPAAWTSAQEWHLVGITGQQGDTTPNGQGGFLYPDHTLYEIDLTDGGPTPMFQTTFVNDSQAIGYCPADGRLYHSAGSHSYTNNPLRTGNDQGGPTIFGIGYQDSQYLETIDLTTRAVTAIFNADPCPNPDPSLPCFGLPAPRPDWLLPVDRRNATQTDASFRAPGVNEYTAARGLAWSTDKNRFYVTDDEGIFTLTRDGISTFLARPSFPSDGSQGDCKGIAFVTFGNTTKLFIGHRKGVGNNGVLMEIDPDTGSPLGELTISYPPGGGDPVDVFGGLLGIEQHPITGVLYGIRKTNDNFARELVTINPITGSTTLIGNTGLHMAGLTFVRMEQSPPFTITGIIRNGNDLALTWSGGTPPYQIETSPSMAAGSWTHLGAPTNATAMTVSTSGPPAFLRIRGQ
jgi:hypothetical protein